MLFSKTPSEYGFLFFYYFIFKSLFTFYSSIIFGFYYYFTSILAVGLYPYYCLGYFFLNPNLFGNNGFSSEIGYYFFNTGISYYILILVSIYYLMIGLF
jgi:hypothetical protein